MPLIEATRLQADRRKVRAGDVIARAGTSIDEVFVPLGLVVMIARQTPLDPVPLTVGLIGYEGLVGWPALLATTIWTHNAIAMAAGEVAVLSRTELLSACAANATLNAVLLRVAHNHTLQMAQSVVANLGHSLERRLARWILMIDDRTPGNTIIVTHAQFAQILNVRRASVTDAIHVLEGEALIISTRGRVSIRDRAALEVRAGQSYGLSEDDYTKYVEPFGKRPAKD